MVNNNLANIITSHHIFHSQYFCSLSRKKKKSVKTDQKFVFFPFTVELFKSNSAEVCKLLFILYHFLISYKFVKYCDSVQHLIN